MVLYYGLTICPFCKGTDTMILGHTSDSSDNPKEYGELGEVVHQNNYCENCGKTWTVEFRPVRWFVCLNGAINPENPQEFGPAAG